MTRLNILEMKEVHVIDTERKMFIQFLKSTNYLQLIR
jgi:hypothetical protein